MSDESQSSNPQPTPSGLPSITPLSQQATTGEDSRVVSRRWMLFNAAIALNGLVGLVLAVPVFRYLLAPWRRDSSYNSWVSLGAANAFPVGETRLANYRNPWMRPWDGQTGDIACYVRNLGGNRFQVFAVNCAHLGCPVRWFPQSQLFMCPCHGGVYYSDGSRAAGPPERGLFTYNWKIVSGELQIDAGQMPTLSNSAKLVKISVGPGDCSCSG